MKTLIHLFLTFLFLLPIVNAQEPHTYSSREVVYYNYIKKTTNSEAPYHWGEYEGHRCGAYEYNYNIRNINFWEWNYSIIPVQATVSSVTLRFRAYKNHSHNFSFKLYNIPYSRSNTDINFYNECTSERTIFSSPVYSPDGNNTIYYNQTYTEQSPIGQGWEIWNAVNNAVQSGNYYFTIGIQENLPSLYNHWWIAGYDGGYSTSPAIDLIINFTTPDNYYTFKNKIQSNESYGSLILNDDIEDPIPSSSAPVFLSWGTPNKIRTAELPFLPNWNGTGTTQKHNYWDLQTDTAFVLRYDFDAISSSPSLLKATFLPTSTAVIKNYLTEYSNTTLGNVGIIDPWYYYEDEVGQWIQDGEPNFYSSPIDIQNNATDSYGGVFLNQDYNIPGKPYYSVKVDAIQDIPLFTTGVPTGNGRIHKFYFQNWSGTNVNLQNVNNLETPVVFTSDGATVRANLKGTQLTNTVFADSKSGQRGFLRDHVNGYLHNVYESMGSVWYERSTDNGTTWILMNNGHPVNPGGNAKSPSICENLSVAGLFIVYQCDNPPYDGIVITKFGLTLNDNTPLAVGVIGQITDYNHANDYQPVIAATGSDGGVVVCNPPIIGFRAFNFSVSGSNITTSEFSIPSSPNSSNPSIVAFLGRTHLVFQEAGLSIKYYSWLPGNPTYSSTVSVSSGTTYNLKPVISLLYGGKVVVSWIGATTGYYPTRLNTRVGTPSGSNINWGSYNTIYGLVSSTSNASNISSTQQLSLITWKDMYGTKWQKRETIGSNIVYSNPSALSNNGTWTQATIGVGENLGVTSAKALVFNSSSLPYYFIPASNNFAENNNSSNRSLTEGGVGNYFLGKVTDEDTILTFGRSGVAAINDVEFVFEIGDILVGDSVIRFIEIPDTLVYNSANELNQHTRTNNFTLTPNTNFYFSNIYHVVQKSDPDTALLSTDAVNFKAELVNANNNQVVGTFDNITYNKNSVEKYASIDYSVDCSGITAGEYYLRLVTNVNGNASYTLANIFNENTTLAKKNYNQIKFTGSEIPTTYDLAQNFPNPFNPSTTIRFQIPQDGIVTLKIYDILGAEVATLINEQKVAGKYEVNFNASTLASGVYIYKIQSGDFVSSKKMILIK